MNDSVHALTDVAVALVRQGRLAEAIAVFEQAIALEPGYAHGHDNLARALLLEHRYFDARAQAELAVAIDPKLAQAHATLSAICLRQNQVEEALVHSERALELSPSLVEAQYHKARAFLKSGRLEEADVLSRQVLSAAPDYTDMQFVRGMVDMKLNRPEEALEALNAVLRARPLDGQAHVNRALACLVAGNFEEGWPEYEWRWRGHGFVTKPMWDGSPLDGRTILLHAEQGLGDTLQFIRYAALVKRRAADASRVKVVVACPESLHGLLRRCAGIDELAPPRDFESPADAHALLMSLPGIFQTTLASIPASFPYLFPDPALVSRWGEEISLRPGYNVGIAWQGSPQHPDDRDRSIPLAEFVPLARVPGIRWFSLQKGPGQNQLGAAPFDITQLGPRLDEATGAFMDTAAVIVNLDLVITSDTAIAHLAGGLGARTWVALQLAPDFRWLLERPDCPWYPTMRLFRQRRRGDWHEVFERMALELCDLVRCPMA